MKQNTTWKFPDLGDRWRQVETLNNPPKISAPGTNILGFFGINLKALERWEKLRPTFQNAVAKPGEILIYGPIVDAIEESFVKNYLEDETLMISNNGFREQLNQIEGDVVVRINSPGGSGWEASGIVTAITERRNAGDKVTAIIDGEAASAATVVMVACETITVSRMASIMIHRAQGFMYGDQDEFRKMADFLEKFSDQAADLYAERMTLDKDAVLAAMEEETWYTPEEAIEVGLVDEMVKLEKGKKDDKKDTDADMFKRRNLRLAALTA